MHNVVAKNIVVFFVKKDIYYLRIKSTTWLCILSISNTKYRLSKYLITNHIWLFFIYKILGVDRYVFFRADADTDYYRSSRPITDILNRYTCLV